MDEKSSSKSEQQVLAAVAHASLLFSLFGPIIPAIIWLTSRGKSPYVAFHAMQAMGYQILSFWIWATLAPIIALGFPFLTGGLASIFREAADPARIAPVMMLLISGPFLVILGAYFLIGISGSILCLAGSSFSYPVIGKWLARRLGYFPGAVTPLSEEGEDNYLAAMAHSTAIFSLWGAIFPLMIWVSQKDRSSFLGFQAAQAAIFQVIGAALNLLGLLAYVILLFGIMAVVSAAAFYSGPQSIPPELAWLFIPIMCLTLLILGLGPLFLCLASWAAYRILTGHDYRYPFLGRILARRGAAGEAGGPAPREPFRK
jgi:uncharacterized Tic20 family protein